MSRRISGVVILPAATPTTTALMIVELRDTTYADAPAPVVAATRLPDTGIAPLRRCPFEFEAPESPPRSQLSLRCHLSLTGDGVVTTGDLLTAESFPVASVGDVDGLQVTVVFV